MSNYVDTQIINCNRLASIQSRSKNDSNPALFTNPLNQTIKLNVGDKVSLERAFVSEVGAGNPSTIEFKGNVRGKNPVGKYTKIVPFDYNYNKSTTYDTTYRLGYYRGITTTEVDDEEVELRDNLAPLIIGYYITSNEYPNYIQQPRKFPQNNDTRGDTPVPQDNNHYTDIDSEDGGRCKYTVYSDCFCRKDWITKRAGTTNIIKQIVDNTRFCLFIKDKVGYARFDDQSNYINQFPKKTNNGVISECNYFRIRERVDIEVNKGFNTPSAVADQITQQLTEVKNEEIFEILDTGGFTRPLTKTIETETYKPINVGNLYNYCSQNHTKYGNESFPITGGEVDLQNSIDYITQFAYIGVKRPEIFEKGREVMNALVPNTTVFRNASGAVIAPTLENGFEGLQTIKPMTTEAARTANELDLIHTNLLYTKENCEKLMEFFDTQDLYPEIWDDLQQNIDYRDDRIINGVAPTATTSRFIHMNKYSVDSDDVSKNAAFGDDGYVTRGTNNLASAPIFIKYNPDERNNPFIENPKNYYDVRDGLMFGIFRPLEVNTYNASGAYTGAEYVVGLDCLSAGSGGVPVSLYTDADNSILEGRRLGFDFHATAFSTAIITPYAGFSNIDIGTKAKQNDGKTAGDLTYVYTDTIYHLNPLDTTTTAFDIMPYMTQGYIGANNPILEYNTTTNRFEFSRLHTSNNIGNKAKAGNTSKNIVSKSLTPPAGTGERDLTPPEKNANANSVVYKINPRPSQFGYSPTFKPYIRDDYAQAINPYPETAKDAVADIDATGVNTQTLNAWNDNITPFTPFDSHGGIYIDNWGFDLDNWEDNIWDILGFDYNAVAAEPSPLNVLTKRVNNENSDKLYRPTTNAQIISTDTKSYISNYHDASQYTTALPFPVGVVSYTAKHYNNNDEFRPYAGDAFNANNFRPKTIYNQIDVLTESTSITATDLKKSVLRPYYTIRSDILEGSGAIGGNPTGGNLPIISIVDKYSAANDYFMGNPSSLVFTITKPTIISDITTSIHDSDGEYANVDKTSAVIYKIQRMRPSPVNLIEQILNEKGKEDKGRDKKK